MTTTARTQTEAALQAVEEELTELDSRRKELVTARDSLRTALRALPDTSSGNGRDAPDADETARPAKRATKKATSRSRRSTAPKGRKSTRRKKPTGKGPSVTAEQLVEAVRELGGSADTGALKSHLGVDNGRVLTGARTHAIRQGLLTVDGDGNAQLTDQGRQQAAAKG